MLNHAKQHNTKNANFHKHWHKAIKLSCKEHKIVNHNAVDLKQNNDDPEHVRFNIISEEYKYKENEASSKILSIVKTWLQLSSNSQSLFECKQVVSLIDGVKLEKEVSHKESPKRELSDVNEEWIS